MTASPLIAPEPQSAAPSEHWSSEFDQVRATVQALQSAASLLQASLEQRQALWTAMRGAEQSLSAVQQQRVQAEQALTATRGQLERAAYDVACVRSEQSGLVAEFDKMVQSALVRRGTLVTEIAELERRRETLADEAMPSLIPAVVSQPGYAERFAVPPVFTQPLFAPPVYAEPVATQAVATQPVYEQPVYTPAVIAEPVYEPPVYTPPPVLARHVFEPPAWAPPVTAQPAFEHPFYAPLVIAPPVIPEPVLEQPVYTPPVIRQPVFEPFTAPVAEPLVFARPEFARPTGDQAAFAQPGGFAEPVAPVPLLVERPAAPIPLQARLHHLDLLPAVEPAPPEPTPATEPPRARSGVPWLRLIFSALFGSLLLGLAVLLTPISQVVGGLQLLAVMSGSMEPTIPVGGIVGVRPVPASELHVGDVITFANQSNPDTLVTHRVVTLQSVGGQTLLTTKGDANDAVDAVTTSAGRAVGRVEFSAPWLGYLMFWLASPLAKAGILIVSVVGFALPSLKRSPKVPAPVEASPAVHASQSFLALEREIQDLLPRAS